MKIVFCATHPKASNGYSKVAYELCKRLGAMDDVQLHWFGFQNIDQQSRNVRPLPEGVEVYDAMANENPRKNGFGFELIESYVRNTDPDVVIVYNDAVVCSQIMKKLEQIKDQRFKIVIYQDLVYEHLKRGFVDILNASASRVLAFTPYWQGVLEDHGVTRPLSYIQHGFNPGLHYPVPKELARRYFRLSPSDFIILNLNRNQPRKRWDVVVKAFAEFVSRHRGEAFKLLVGTAVNGSWNLVELYERELKKRGITIDEGMKHMIFIDTPQKLSDEDINVLMNCADIGISAADGEGFGLCNFEHAGIGRPQVIPNIGGFKDFFDSGNSVLCDPILNYYVDAGRDGVGGEAQMIDYQDLTEGMEFYYNNPSALKEHGERARRSILKKYRWDDIAAKLRDECDRVLENAIAAPTPPAEPKLDAREEEAPTARTDEPPRAEPPTPAQTPAPEPEREAPAPTPPAEPTREAREEEAPPARTEEPRSAEPPTPPADPTREAQEEATTAAEPESPPPPPEGGPSKRDEELGCVKEQLAAVTKQLSVLSAVMEKLVT